MRLETAPTVVVRVKDKALRTSYLLYRAHVIIRLLLYHNLVLDSGLNFRWQYKYYKIEKQSIAQLVYHYYTSDKESVKILTVLVTYSTKQRYY